MEQRICVKFCFRLGKTAAETNIMLCLAYGNEILSKRTTSEW